MEEVGGGRMTDGMLLMFFSSLDMRVCARGSSPPPPLSLFCMYEYILPSLPLLSSFYLLLSLPLYFLVNISSLASYASLSFISFHIFSLSCYSSFFLPSLVPLVYFLPHSFSPSLFPIILLLSFFLFLFLSLFLLSLWNIRLRIFHHSLFFLQLLSFPFLSLPPFSFPVLPPPPSIYVFLLLLLLSIHFSFLQSYYLIYSRASDNLYHLIFSSFIFRFLSSVSFSSCLFPFASLHYFSSPPLFL